MSQEEFVPLPRVPSHINIDLERFGRKNFWHGSFHNFFSIWIFNKYREEAWIGKFITLFVLELYQMKIERFSTCHESTSSRIRVEDYETLQ